MTDSEPLPPPAVGDAFGQALQRCWAGGARRGIAYEVVERDDGHIGVTDAAEYFNPPEDWSPLEHLACDTVRGRVLDVGCGAGRHAVVLAAKGVKVTGLEPSPGAAALARERGVPVVEGSIHEHPRDMGRYDTILLLGNNLALLGGRDTAAQVLDNLARLAAPDGTILGIGMDPYTTTEPAHLRYHDLNRQRDRHPGLIRMRVRHADIATPWFDYLFVSADELRDLLADSPWQLASVDTQGGTSYLATLTHA